MVVRNYINFRRTDSSGERRDLGRSGGRRGRPAREGGAGRRRRLGETLLGLGEISHHQLGEGIALQARRGGLLGDILIRRRFCTPGAVSRALSLQGEPSRKIGEILVALGVLTRKKLVEILELRQHEGTLTGQLVIEHGLAEPTAVAEALRYQNVERQCRLRLPRAPRLGALLVELGHLRRSELESTLAAFNGSRGFLGQALVEAGKLEPEQLSTALAYQEAMRSLHSPWPTVPRLGQILLGREAVSEEDLASMLGRQEELGGLLGDLFVGDGLASAKAVEEALQAQADLREATRFQRADVESTPAAGTAAAKRGRLSALLGRIGLGPGVRPLPRAEPPTSRERFPWLTETPRASPGRQLLRLLQFVPIVGLAAFWVWLFPPEEAWNASVLYKWAWLVPLPFAVGSVAGLLTPLISQLDPRRVRRPVRRLYICLVTRGTNPETVRRSYQALKGLQDEQVRVTIVTDHPLSVPHLLVPPGFRPERARFKARALEFFRQAVKLEPDDWVLHLDEESIVDEVGVRRCLEFARHSPHLWGQGLILYNQHEWWRRPLLSVADSIRVGDDLGRFNLQFTAIHRPIFGVHGSFLLCSGIVENAVTWDYGGLTEDFEFSTRCMELGLSCGKVEGVIREQSPDSWRDFLKQRKRWFCGIQHIQHFWPRVWWVLWMLSPLSIMATIYNVIFPTPTPVWLGIGGALTFSTFAYLYFLGALTQDLDRGSGPLVTAWHSLQVLLLFPVAAFLESCAVVWGLLKPARTFEVIRK